MQISIDSIKELVSNPKSISVNTMAAMLDGAVNNLLINYFLNDYPIEAEEIADQIVTIFCQDYFNNKDDPLNWLGTYGKISEIR